MKSIFDSSADWKYFPPLSDVSRDGLLMEGGQLNPDWLLAAYRQGIFPWPYDEHPETPIAWWCPDPRGVLPFDSFHISRSLDRSLRATKFKATWNRDFLAVIEACAAAPREDEGTWITPAMIAGFQRLHQMGTAHSVEIWEEDELVGGVYGVAIGCYFSAESKFHTRRDASKVALARLIHHLKAAGLTWLDVQQINDHTQRLGAVEISREEFLTRHHQASQRGPKFDLARTELTPWG